MAYFVKANVDDHIVSAAAMTAKEAFAKAVHWQVARQLKDVAISDGEKDYSVAEFADAMEASEIDVTWQKS